MAAVAAVIKAIVLSSWRDLRSLGAFAGNNLLAVIALLMANEPGDRPSSTTGFFFLIGLLYLFPLAKDVSQRIPPSRSRLWPLTRRQRALVYVANLVLNPLLLIAILFAALSRDKEIGVGLFAAGVAAPFLLSGFEAVFPRGIAWGSGLLRLVPQVPGPLGGLIQSHVRELLGMLDFYFAATFAVGGVVYRVLNPHPDPVAPLVIGQLTVILLSTLAQCPSAFNAQAARTRARLLPLSGTAILLATDIAWLAVLLVLAWPSPLLPGIGAAAMTLAVGHQASAKLPIEQRRWRFAQGRIAPLGLAQMLGLISAAVLVHQFGWRILPLFLAIYLASLWWFGRAWDQNQLR